jgi:hypothetical protein
MNVAPLLNKTAKAFAEHRLEAVMVGNRSAALKAAPATTLRIDFIFRKTRTNLKKLRACAKELGAGLFKQYYPRADCFCLFNDDLGWRVTLLACRDLQSSGLQQA